MRLLQCIWQMSVGGAERQLLQLTQALISRGVDVHVASVYAGPCDDELAATGAAMHRLRPLGKYDVSLVPRMMATLRRLRPRVVSTWLSQMDIVAGMAAATMRVPWVICERSSAVMYSPGLINGVRRRVGAHASAIVANSEGGREYWRRYVDDARIHVIPNIVPLGEIERAAVASENVAPDEEVILFVGRLSAEKNAAGFIEALARVLPRRKAKGVVCGDGIQRATLERRAAELGIADRTLFLGNVSNVFGWMKRAAVVVAVSTFEGNPNVVLEAIAAGTPVVVSDIPPYRAVVGVECAWLVDPLSADAIAAGINAALGDRGAARARAERARAVVEGRSGDQIAAQYIELFEGLARNTK